MRRIQAWKDGNRFCDRRFQAWKDGNRFCDRRLQVWKGSGFFSPRCGMASRARNGVWSSAGFFPAASTGCYTAERPSPATASSFTAGGVAPLQQLIAPLQQPLVTSQWEGVAPL
ncbi:hypothetical protein B296_00024586 [Ensete ventricosum]|uniref:Uncharacterized protein n=1 Tax=Ensete ventricosum TaxID=4639 RepID=A0A426ZVU2_ENSVE|nr:hypothetical protein B296_00024586 [Ensete ventricosum]